MTSFKNSFAGADAIIMAALGDDITLTPPTGAAVIALCALAARPGSGDKDVVSWTDNLWAKIDVMSIIVELLESAAPALAKNWTALYDGKSYVVTEIFRNGNGVMAVVLNPQGNAAATGSGWR
jgi:hypothetical protein